MFLEPCTIAHDPCHHEFLWGRLRPGSELYKVTQVQVQDLEQKLNLGHVVFRDFVFNFSSHRTLDLHEDTIFRDAVGRSAQKGPLWVLHEPYFVRLSARQGVVHVTGHGLELCAVLRRLVPGPGLFQNFFVEQRIWTFVPIEPEGTRNVTRREEILTEREPLGTPLFEVLSVQEFLDPGVHSDVS